jgi:tetratricopeptide (TPR) repeat protein
LRSHKLIAVALLLVSTTLVGFSGWSPTASVSFRSKEIMDREDPGAIGLTMYQQRRFHEAVVYLTAAIKADPSLASAYFARGRAYLQLGDADARQSLQSWLVPEYQSALADFQQADNLAPDARTKAMLGYCTYRIYPSLVSATAAEGYFQKAIEDGFGTAEIFNNLGFIQINKLEYQLAQHNLDKAIQLNDRLQAAFHNRARVSLDRILLKDNSPKNPEVPQPVAESF